MTDNGATGRWRSRRALSVATTVMCAFTLLATAGRTDVSPQPIASERRPSRTQIKWLINTATIRPSLPAGRNDSAGSRRATTATITRLQMIHGGTSAVLVMPSGAGASAPFSLGRIGLRHGFNNLYPAILPFPDWSAYSVHGQQLDQDDATDKELTSTKPAADNCKNNTVTNSTKRRRRGTANSARRIVNAVDAFLDDRGRLLWVLDTSSVGQNACRLSGGDVGDTSSSNSTADVDDDDDVEDPPKFLAVDVQTNRIVSVVSLQRVWRPGVSCFQYIVAVYSNANPSTDDDLDDVESDMESGGGKDKDKTGNGECMEWPLVVVGDAGTNRLLVYSHSVDRYTEIMLPLEEEHRRRHRGDNEKKYGKSGEGVKNQTDQQRNSTSSNHDNRRRRNTWHSPPVRDILYMAPLEAPVYSANSTTRHSPRLLVTYYGCQDIYRLWLQPSISSVETAVTLDTGDDGVTPAPPAPVTGTLNVLARKPCHMIVLGTDRRRFGSTSGTTDFLGGGTTVYFRLENTNDLWSWDTSSKNRRGLMSLLIDERDFRLVRLGRTCRVPVAVSAAPAIVSDNIEQDLDKTEANTERPGDNVDRLAGAAPAKSVDDRTSSQIQLVWMLETNFVDHFAGTTDRMGVNAKLQPLEAPPYGEGDAAGLPLRVQPNHPDPLRPRTTPHCFPQKGKGLPKNINAALKTIVPLKRRRRSDF